MATEGESIPLIASAAAHGARFALIADEGRLSYAELRAASARAAARLLAGHADLEGARVAFLATPGLAYVVALWGIWRAGGIAVPLCTSHPRPELEYTIDDAEAAIVLAPSASEDALERIAAARGVRFMRYESLLDPAELELALPHVAADRAALLLYTSGTTGKPKGVVTTHAMLAAQVRSVVAAWEIDAHDRLLHALPLHHLHGVLNALSAPLAAGACCELLPRFHAERVLARVTEGAPLTLFMGVPTMYSKLITAYEGAPAERRAAIERALRQLRLMVSGSAALPVATLERFLAISGHTLLERYGMTEFGMGLGNPLHGERRPGSVGVPFPGIEVRLRAENGASVADGSPGELQVKGDGVFAEYWRRPSATQAAFTGDGWFKTGDIAQLERGAYRILGRESVDILKTGGFKVSALEIEETMREHPAILECAVVGVADEAWGQRVAIAVVRRPGAELTLELLRAWGKQRLAPYKVPSLLRVLTQLPRNPMGKVQKPELAALFAGSAPE